MLYDKINAFLANLGKPVFKIFWESTEPLMVTTGIFLASVFTVESDFQCTVEYSMASS